MKIDKNNLYSRREFFKEASEKALPLLGMALLVSTPILCSCTKDPDPSECNGCSNNCEGNSTSSGCSSCSNNCQNSSTSSGCSNCSSGCDSGCTNDCSVNCSNSSNNSPNETISEASGSIDGHEYVDLGLSVKWARCNVNATQPYTFGIKDYPRIYKLPVEEAYPLLYSLGLSFSSIQQELGGVPEFDIATEKWGNSWTTPSASEWQELIENCDFEAIELEEVWGARAVSKINGRSIFIPIQGTNKINYFNSSTFRLDNIYSINEIGAIKLRRTNSNSINYTTSNIRYTESYVRAVTTGSGGGPTNCNGNCTNTAQNSCSSCQIGCSSTCTQQCSSNCSTGCKSNCTGSCINGCNTGCGGSCHYSCGGTCSYVSSGSHCTSGTCATTCSSYCYRTCSLACSQSCQSCCITSAK